MPHARIAIDVTGVSSALELHQRLARALAFPAWYGHTWDSFEECIGELPGQIILVLVGGRELERTLGVELRLLHEVLAHHAQQNPHAAVSLVLADAPS